MHFFDCNVFIGLSMKPTCDPMPTAEALLAEMQRAGIKRALVWHIAQYDASPQLGNRLLSEAIAPHPELVGCWTILPHHTRELPLPEEFFQRMREAGIGAIRIFPDKHRFRADGITLGAWLEQMVTRRVPLFLSIRRGTSWDDVYRLLADFPHLVCVICDHGIWGDDRHFRPLLERYPNTYVDLSQYHLDGGIESLVADYGAQRILFGSGFPESYFGGMMLALRHAQIPDDAKAAIASGNLERILAEEEL